MPFTCQIRVVETYYYDELIERKWPWYYFGFQFGQGTPVVTRQKMMKWHIEQYSDGNWREIDVLEKYLTKGE